jgi:hypothetical protein
MPEVLLVYFQRNLGHAIGSKVWRRSLSFWCVNLFNALKAEFRKYLMLVTADADDAPEVCDATPPN